MNRDPAPTRQLLVVVTALLVMLWGVLLVGGCRRTSATNGPAATSKKIQVVTTTGMVRDMLIQIMGDSADVHAIMGAGVDPHLYQPSRGDAVRLLEADVVVYNGLHLEGRLGEAIGSREKSGGITIAAGELLDPSKLMDADAGLYDPHIWMDVSLWGETVELVAKALADHFPEERASIVSRAEAYRSELADLDRWGQQAIDSVPEKQRVLVTAHDAFRYFGKRYGVEVHGVQGVSTASTPAISDVNRLVDLIVAKNVPAIFFESSVSPGQVQAIVEGAQQRGLNVSSDSTLLSDSMGADHSPEGTYLGMMRHNFRTITEALGGEVSDASEQAATEPNTPESETEAAAAEPVESEQVAGGSS